MKELPRWLILLAGAALLLVVAAGFSGTKNYSSFVPREMQVSGFLYAKEESAGFIPSGHEAGVVVYALPEKTAQEITVGGIEYFAGLSSREPSGDWREYYKDWRSTPVVADEDWTKAAGETENAKPDIEQFLSRYALNVALDPATRRMIDDVISSPGNFYSYGRLGLLIVAPEKRRIIYTYSR